MGRLFPLLIIIVMFVFALIDCLSTDGDRVRTLPKALWVLLIVFLPLIGAIAWLLAGRPKGNAGGTGVRRTGGGVPRPGGPQRPVAPDDDPDFLRGLAQQRRDDEDLLRRWEADLRRREEDLRDDDGPTEPPHPPR